MLNLKPSKLELSRHTLAKSSHCELSKQVNNISDKLRLSVSWSVTCRDAWVAEQPQGLAKCINRAVDCLGVIVEKNAKSNQLHL